MRIHHLNCISSCPLGGHLMDAGHEPVIDRGRLTNHCLLIEADRSLVLVDTGFGLKEVANAHSRLSEFFLTLNSPDFREELTAIRQIERLGFDPRDVRDIVLTHLDFDHAGGLDDFPEAKVHMIQSERESAVAQKTWLDRQRYRPQQWATMGNWVTHDPGEGEDWFGFGRVRPLADVGPELAMIPLSGHTFGHAGVAVRTDDRWSLLAGDAYFFHEEMNFEKPHCTPGLTAYQRLMDKDHKSRVWNQERLRELVHTHSSEVEVYCSHDVTEFERVAGRSFEESAQREVLTGRTGGDRPPTPPEYWPV